MTAVTPPRLYGHPTPADFAHLLVLEELRRRKSATPDPLLDFRAWRHVGTVRILICRSPKHLILPRTSDELSTTLCYLVGRGLVDEEVAEGRVSETRPQLYRWARCATDDVLARFAKPVERKRRADDEDACAREGCPNGRDGRKRYCSQACNQLAWKARKAAKA